MLLVLIHIISNMQMIISIHIFILLRNYYRRILKKTILEMIY